MADASPDPKLEDEVSDATDDDDLDALEAEVAKSGRGRPTKLSKSEEAKVRLDLQQKLDALLEHSRSVMESMATGKRTVKYVPSRVACRGGLWYMHGQTWFLRLCFVDVCLDYFGYVFPGFSL